MKRYKSKFNEGIGKVDLDSGIMKMFRIVDIPGEIESKIRITNFSRLGVYSGDYMIFSDEDSNTFQMGFSSKAKRQIMFNYITRLLK